MHRLVRTKSSSKLQNQLSSATFVLGSCRQCESLSFYSNVLWHYGRNSRPSEVRTISRSQRISTSKGENKFLDADVHFIFHLEDVTETSYSHECQKEIPARTLTISRLREFRAEDTGAVLGDCVTNAVDEKFFKPILLKTGNATQNFEFLFDYYGMRYHLLLEYNNEDEDCEENRSLQKLYESMGTKCHGNEVDGFIACVKLSLPYVVKDCESRPNKSTEMPTLSERYACKKVVKMQLKSGDDGSLHRVAHDVIINYPLSEPIENPCPSFPLFGKDEVELLEEIRPRILKVRVRGEIHCLKIDHSEQLLREITILSKMPAHPSLPRLIGVVDAGDGKVDQFVMTLVRGSPLSSMTNAAKELKEMWKLQITEAVQVLHKNGIVWGDAYAANIVIEEETSRAVLIDFGDASNNALGDKKSQGTTAGDLQAVNSLFTFMDELN